MRYTNLGKKIKEERIKMGLTQEELGEKIDSTGAYVGQIERGERNASVAKIMLIAEKLNTSMDYLTGNMCLNDNSSIDSKILEELRNATNSQKEIVKEIIKIIKKYG